MILQKWLHDSFDTLFSKYRNGGIHLGGSRNLFPKIWGATKFYLAILGATKKFQQLLGGYKIFLSKSAEIPPQGLPRE